MMQMFCGHLQDLLKEQTSLRQRLMRPLGRANLPVQADLHRWCFYYSGPDKQLHLHVLIRPQSP